MESRFEAVFLNENIQTMYKAEQRISRLLTFFNSHCSCDIVPGFVWTVRLHRGAEDQRDRYTKSGWRFRAKHRVQTFEGIHSTYSGFFPDIGTVGLLHDDEMA